MQRADLLPGFAMTEITEVPAATVRECQLAAASAVERHPRLDGVMAACLVGWTVNDRQFDVPPVVFFGLVVKVAEYLDEQAASLGAVSGALLASLTQERDDQAMLNKSARFDAESWRGHAERATKIANENIARVEVLTAALREAEGIVRALAAHRRSDFRDPAILLDLGGLVRDADVWMSARAALGEGDQ